MLSGYYGWGTGYVLAQNLYGVWWTSSVQSASTAYFTIVIDDQLTQSHDPKYVGHSLRCKNSGLFPAGSSATRSYPVSLVLSGLYDWRTTAGDKYYQNGLGVWWSSNGSDPDNALDLNISTSRLEIQANNVRQYGFTLRCVKLFIH